MVAALTLSAGALSLESWHEQRYAGVVRQQHDFSCGLAALATVLAIQSQLTVTEAHLLEELETVLASDASTPLAERELRRGVSMAELGNLAGAQGFRAIGLELPHDQLTRLRQPVLVAMDAASTAHFSVLRAVDEKGRYKLADPSWGNLKLTPHQFARRFEGDRGKGRILVLLPQDAQDSIAPESPASARRDTPRYRSGGQPR